MTNINEVIFVAIGHFQSLWLCLLLLVNCSSLVIECWSDELDESGM